MVICQEVVQKYFGIDFTVDVFSFPDGKPLFLLIYFIILFLYAILRHFMEHCFSAGCLSLKTFLQILHFFSIMVLLYIIPYILSRAKKTNTINSFTVNKKSTLPWVTQERVCYEKFSECFFIYLF